MCQHNELDEEFVSANQLTAQHVDDTLKPDTLKDVNR